MNENNVLTAATIRDQALRALLWAMFYGKTAKLRKEAETELQKIAKGSSGTQQQSQ